MTGLWRGVSHNSAAIMAVLEYGGDLVKDYWTLEAAAEHEIVINKSRFIGISYPVTVEEQIPECLADARRRYAEANHYCFGCILGVEGLIQRFSDDGEPGGTAGMPILQVLQQQELRNTLIVIVRYFGGIKLGAGGLVRAYTKAAVEVIRLAGRVRMIWSSRGVLSIEYPLLGTVEHYLRQHHIPVLETVYKEDVELVVMTREPWETLCEKIIDLCNGQASMKELDPVYYNWK